MKKNKQNIKCSVVSCKHNNCNESKCVLPEIKIGCCSDKDNAKCKDDTICKNYDEKKE